MPRCVCCGKKFNYDRQEEIYDEDDFITEHDLEGTYGNFIDMCAECAIDEAMSAWGTGQDYLDDDD